MATSNVPNPKFCSHARSISLPTSSHPLITNVEEHLQRLKSSQSGDIASSSSSSSSSHTLACQKLDALKNLYEYVDDALRLPLLTLTLTHQRRCGNGKYWEEEVLDGSLRLLDICGSVRDIYSQMKESVHELESSLRRKRCGDLDNEIQTYTISKKRLNKMISKCYKEMKNLALVQKDSEWQSESTIPPVNLMKQVQEVSAKVLESTLSLISPSSSRWSSLVSKLVAQQNRASSQSHNIPYIQKVQVEMKSYKEGDHVVQFQKVVKALQEMDSSIQELAEVLDTVFRLLLKTRVSLLNILNH